MIRTGNNQNQVFNVLGKAHHSILGCYIRFSFLWGGATKYCRLQQFILIPNHSALSHYLYWIFRHTCDDPLKHKTVPTLYKHKWKKGPNYVTFGNLVIGPSFVSNFQGSRTNTLNNPLEIPHIPVISSSNPRSNQNTRFTLKIQPRWTNC